MLKFYSSISFVLFTLILPTSTAAQTPDLPMTFKLAGNGGNCGDCQWVAAEGVITKDTPASLQAFLEQFETGDFVFNSPGGNLVASLKMGMMLRAAKAATSVGRTVKVENWHSRDDGICASACAFAFLGGVRRDVEPGRLGVHQFYDQIALDSPNEPIFSALDMSENQLASALLLNYVVEMGVDPRFVSKAASVTPTEMHYLTDDELKTWNVSLDPDVLGAWEIKAYQSGVIAVASSADDRTSATVFCRSDQIPRIAILTHIDHMKDDEFTNPLLYLDGFSVFGVEVAVSSVKASFSDGVYALQIPVPSLRDQKLDLISDFVIGGSTARAYESLVNFELSREGAPANIRVALNNCISSGQSSTGSRIQPRRL